VTSGHKDLGAFLDVFQGDKEIQLIRERERKEIE
jgi:hypothetical protein